MPSNQFNTGRDCQLVVTGPYGRVDLEYVTAFEPQQLTTEVLVKPLGQPPMGAYIPGGWTMAFTIMRGNMNADQLISQIENDWWNNGNLSTGQVVQYIAEVGGGSSTWQYNNVTFKLTNAGKFEEEKSVDQTLDMFASRRILL